MQNANAHLALINAQVHWVIRKRLNRIIVTKGPHDIPYRMKSYFKYLLHKSPKAIALINELLLPASRGHRRFVSFVEKKCSSKELFLKGPRSDIIFSG